MTTQQTLRKRLEATTDNEIIACSELFPGHDIWLEHDSENNEYTVYVTDCGTEGVEGVTYQRSFYDYREAMWTYNDIAENVLTPLMLGMRMEDFCC